MATFDRDNELIERIVREVLAALLRASDSSSPSGEQGPGARSPESQDRRASSGREGITPDQVPPSSSSLSKADRPLARIVSTRDGEIVLTDRVITLAHVADQLQGVRRVVVPAGAIVTPAVQDLLREKGISVCYGTPKVAGEGSGVSPTMSSPVNILLVTQKITPSQLDHLLRPEGISAEYEVLDCLIRASERAAELCRRQRLVVVVTRHASAEVCLANRQPGVRAVMGRDPQEVGGDTAAVGANVLVADLTAGLFGLKRMIRQFVASSHTCPEIFRERLEKQ